MEKAQINTQEGGVNYTEQLEQAQENLLKVKQEANKMIETAQNAYDVAIFKKRLSDEGVDHDKIEETTAINMASKMPF